MKITNAPREAAVRAPAGATHRRRIPILAGAVATLGLLLLGVGTASAAPNVARMTSSSQSGGSGGGGDNGGTWDQSKVPLPHLPGQAPVFVLQSQKIADVVALDQTSEAAADAAMIAFYQNNTACTVDTHPMPSVQETIICPRGTATTTDALAGDTWIHVFRLK